VSQLTFDVLDVQPERYAVVPTMTARLRVAETTGEAIHAIALRCQIRIEPQRRRYSPEEEEGLRDLFGSSEQWSTSLKPFLWTHEATMIPGFRGSAEFDLPITCTYDFEVAASKYLHALADGAVPLLLLFNGTVFSRGATGFTVEQVSWDKEAGWQLPVSVWREVMDQHFPNSAWIRVHRDTLDSLHRFRTSRALPSWEQTFEALLAEVRA
jgi:Family of unknown function (DUF6084)